MAEPALSDEAAVTDDLVLPFAVRALGVRGRIVRLGAVADDIIGRHAYGEPAARALGEGLVLASVLGSTLKFDGRMILQVQTDGPLSLLVADYTAPGGLRGYCRHEEGQTDGPLFGDGHMAFTIDQGADMNRYQGIVPMEGDSLSAAAHTYFNQSEQIPTRVLLAASPLTRQGQVDQPVWRAGGLILQHLPEEGGVASLDTDDERPRVRADQDWDEAVAFFQTIQDDELLDPAISPQGLLYRLFHEQGVEVFEPVTVEARCRCSEERIRLMLSQFSEAEKADMVEDGEIGVTCEFCNRKYAFTPESLA